MKRGSRFPQARARWCTNDYYKALGGPPCWVHFLSFRCVILIEILDILVPISIIQSDMSDGQWSYRPSNGEIQWHGTWDVTFASGDWYITQRPSIDESVFSQMWLTYDTGTYVAQHRWDNRGQSDLGGWDEYLWTPRFWATEIVTDYPFIPSGSNGAVPTRYQELRALGIDSHNLEPVTWELPP